MTVLYFDMASNFTIFTPTAHAAWDNTSNAFAYGLKPAGYSGFTDTAYANFLDDNGAVAATNCRIIAVSPPLTSIHSWSTAVGCNFVAKWSEAAASQNAFSCWSLGVISNDGSSVLWQTSIMKDNSEIPTTMASRNNGSGYTAGSYTNVSGDRVFVEIGYDKDAAVAGNVSINLGYLAASVDLSNTDGDTGADNPFVNISSFTFTFGAESAPGSSTDFNGLMMMGCGT